MSKRFLFVICFVLVVGVGSLAQAVPIDVNNFSFEFLADGNQIYCHGGMEEDGDYPGLMGWKQSGTAYCGVDPYCLGDAEYDPNSLTMVCTPEECFTDNHSGCHCWPATHGIVYCYLQATKPAAASTTFLYQNMDPCDPNAVITASRKYVLTWDAMSEIYGGSLETAYSIASFYYGGDPTVEANVVATVSYPLPLWIGDLNEWEHEWVPNLTLKWVATEGHPAVTAGGTLGLRWFSPSPGGPVRAYTMTDNVRLEWVWATDAYDPVPADGAEDVARDVNLAWTSGLYADKHIVYFHEDFNKVDTLHEDANQGLQDPCTFDPTPLGGQFDLGKTYYWRIKEVNDGFVDPGGGVPSPPWDGDTWSFTVTGYATNPKPYDGQKNVPFIGTILSWTPGTDSNSHDVYFGTDEDDVDNANTSVTLGVFIDNNEANSYSPGAMLFGRKYYWRIDEVNEAEATVVKGKVWNFTIAQYYVVDDFDSYANTSPELYAVWNDYWVNLTGGKVFVEKDANFTEDGNAMEYLYDNSSDPCYSEAYADIATLGVTGNWTHSGLEVLTLSFLGQPGNALDDMYVALRDGSNVTGTVQYPDVNELGIDWTGFRQWNIELSEFVSANSVDITDIARITIGFGDKGAGGGSGYVYFDNIRLYPPRCRPEIAFAQGSFDWDQNCEVDSEDLVLLAERDWLIRATGNVTTTPPDANYLVGWWKMDDNNSSGPLAAKLSVRDWSGIGNHGVLYDVGKAPGQSTGAHHDPCCVEGTGSLTFDAFDDYVNLPAFNLDSNTVTISTWVKRLDQPLEMYAGFVFCFYSDPCDPCAPGTGAGLGLGSGGTYGFRDWEPWEINYELCYFWGADLSEQLFDYTWDFHTGLLVPPEEWVMAALVVEPTKASVYMYDGELQVATNYATHYAELFNGPSHIGEQMQYDERFFGGSIDDVRIYSYSLPPEEVLYMALQGPGSQYVELPWWRTDADDDDIINFVDYRIMADNWLEELRWP